MDLNKEEIIKRLRDRLKLLDPIIEDLDQPLTIHDVSTGRTIQAGMKKYEVINYLTVSGKGYTFKEIVEERNEIKKFLETSE